MFLDIKDLTGKIQLYIKKDNIGEERMNVAMKLDIGDFIGVKGRLFKTRTEEITIFVDDFVYLSMKE